MLLFPGAPGGRLFDHPDESMALSLGARIITVDRPGFGLSGLAPGRAPLGRAEDVTARARSVEIRLNS